jgi:hypothetical protein
MEESRISLLVACLCGIPGHCPPSATSVQQVQLYDIHRLQSLAGAQSSIRSRTKIAVLLQCMAVDEDMIAVVADFMVGEIVSVKSTLSGADVIAVSAIVVTLHLVLAKCSNSLEAITAAASWHDSATVTAQSQGEVLFVKTLTINMVLLISS